ncbi:MAG: aminotransferase class III-fold pyridoxal phosphate-dependent enzyme [Candidatus Micrarchaeales archaeon]|jgi:4-aminobutyrate aminotransferase and related aminotransferases|uniref:Aminotransferase class-III n=1 Tax=Candidatus Micrarchaeum acidiphilum ARMAN-2 TaxID=425595 RepID=C7DI25_MICA2|nr:MAG: aminotransferase class-III [Candidatus Micrarchaeum acidiphilum ARMAN-2]MCW6160847.1 aminotransferase class III-fold pyridoxal phosphate-dependent enzyme [Candidatus Micrarchaeales archaeon]
MIKISKRTQNVIANDKKLFLTTTKEDFPFVADHGDGDFVYDLDGNKFIDFSSFISVYNLGVNANARIREAAKAQIDKLIHPAFTDYYAELPTIFARKLISMLPRGYGKLFLSNSGTEANEAALKFSNVMTGKQYTMAFYNAFHGRTKGALGLTASKSIQRSHFGPFPNSIHVPFPYCYRCPFNEKYPGCGFACIDYIKKYPLSKEVDPKEIAAFFIEPIQGEGGYVVPPLDYFKELKKVLDEYGILMVADEVQSGYMRTGKFLALENFGVTADMYTMAKSIAGGFPMGVTAVSKELGDIPAGAHANTFGGNLVSVAAANASIDYVIKNKAVLHKLVVEKGKAIMKRLREMQEKYEIIGDVRGIGLMIGIEIVKDRKTKEPGIKERSRILEESFNNGLIMLPAGASSIRIIPPLTVSKGAMEKGLNILEASFKSVCSK